MKRIGKRLTFLAMLVMILVGLCGCNADLNRLLFGYVAEVRDSSGIHEFDSIQEGIDYIVQRNGASRDVESRASGDAEVIKEEDTVYLIRDVGEGEYGEFFKGKSITVNNYGGVIGIDFQDHVYRFENDTEGGMFFNILDGSEVHIRGGHTIILASNISNEYAMIVKSPNVKLTDHWLEDRRVHSKLMDEDRVTEWNLTKGVYVGANGKLVIDGEKTELGSVIEVKTGGEFEIDNCKLTRIYALKEEDGEGTANVTIKGGTIEHPHKLGPRVSSAASGYENSVKHEFVHVPSDFIYEGSGNRISRNDIPGETGDVYLYDSVKFYCNKTAECVRNTEGSVTMTVDGSYDLIDHGRDEKKPCHIRFTNWKFEPKKTDKDIQYWNNRYIQDTEATIGVGYMLFRNNISGTKTYCGIEFEIKAGSGYGGIDVVLPEDSNVDEDGSKPEGELIFENGKIRFNKTGGGDVRQWKWIVDNDKYSLGDGVGASGSTAQYATGDTPAQINISQLEREGKIESGKSHHVVLYVKNRKGQTACSMNVYMPEGELTATLFRQKNDSNKVEQDVQKVVFTPVNHADDAEAQTGKIKKWAWKLGDGGSEYEVMTGTELQNGKLQLDLPVLSANTDITGTPARPSTWNGSGRDFVNMSNFALVSDGNGGFVPVYGESHSVKLEIEYWDNSQPTRFTYELKTREGSSEISGYKVRTFELWEQ